MSDLVVTVPKDLWADWIAEGDAAGEPDSGEEWGFYLGGPCPPIKAGERLYVVAWGLVRGYSPVTRLARRDGRWVICRKGGAIAVTIDEPAPGFRGWRRRWWRTEQERPFADWKTAGLPARRQMGLALPTVAEVAVREGRDGGLGPNIIVERETRR